MNEWIAKHPDELRPGLYVPVQALQEEEARVEELEAKIEKMKEIITDTEPTCGECCEAIADGFTICGDCSC